MYKINIIAVIFSVFIVSCANNKPPQKSVDLNCASLQACLDEIKNVEYEKYGISNEASSLAERFPGFGDEALVGLMKLLKSDDPTTLNVAGYAIAKFDTIDQKYFPEIKAGIEKDVPWLPRALGAIKSVEAAEYAVEIYLTASSSPHNQEARAVIKQGESALPFIFAQANCNASCDDGKLRLLTYIVGEMEAPAKKVVAERVIAQLKTTDMSQQNKRNLISLLFKLGDSGKFIEDQLRQIEKEQPDLGLAIQGAYVGIKSKYSGRVFASHLKSSPDIFTLRDVSEMGPAAQDAGPVLIDLLSHTNRDIRLGAARALGYLEYKDAVSALIPLIDDKNDVRLNWVAVKSLAMIADPASLEALLSASESHWYPAVKDAARQAVHSIKNGSVKSEQSAEDNFAFDFFGYQDLEVKSCENVTLKRVIESPPIKLHRPSDYDRLKKLTYDSYVLSYGADDEEEQQQKDPDAVIKVHRYNMVEHRNDIKQTPDVALKIEDGWLAGSDRGEWGGELVFIPDNGKSMKLLDGNVENIYKLGDRYVVVSGLSHLGLNNGKLFRLQRNDKEWQIEEWINLPGAPMASWIVESGELLVNTESGGNILISPAGDLKMAPCDENKE